MVFFTMSLSAFGWGWNSSVKMAKKAEVIPGAGITIEEFVEKLEDRINELSGEKAKTVWSKVDSDGKDMVKIEMYKNRSKKTLETIIILSMNDDQEVEYGNSGGELGNFQSYPKYIHNVATQVLGDQALARQAYLYMIN